MNKTTWLYWLGIGLALGGCTLSADILHTGEATKTKQAQPADIAAQASNDPLLLECLTDKRLHSFQDNSFGLYKFLLAMPKGADLHNHLSGAVTTERLIEWGAEDGLCINQTTWTAEPPPCKNHAVPLAKTKSDHSLHYNVMAAWSMNGFEGPLLKAHQHFFDAFGKFGAVISEQRADDALAQRSLLPPVPSCWQRANGPPCSGSWKAS